MMVEIAGAVLLWALGTLAIGEWFALQRLNARYDRLAEEYSKVKSDYKHLIEVHRTLPKE